MFAFGFIKLTMFHPLHLLVLVGLAFAKKPPKSGIITLRKEQLRETLGVRSSKRAVAECGVLAYLMAPITTSDEALQRSEQDAQRTVVRTLKALSKKVSGDEVTFAKFPFAANKIYILTHTTIEESWSGSLAFIVTPPTKMRKTWDRRAQPLTAEKLDDSSEQGIARFLDARCGTALAKRSTHDEV